MSKKAKTQAAAKRKAEKARIKAANTAKYESWRDAGTNSKTRRARTSMRKSREFQKHRHDTDDCGNIGCKVCCPVGHRLAGHKGVIYVASRV